MARAAAVAATAEVRCAGPESRACCCLWKVSELEGLLRVDEEAGWHRLMTRQRLEQEAASEAICSAAGLQQAACGWQARACMVCGGGHRWASGHVWPCKFVSFVCKLARSRPPGARTFEACRLWRV